jgi:hypothetical protein
MSPQIKFERDYPKLQGLARARLLQVLMVPFGQLSPIFLGYDTKQVGGTHYRFPISSEDFVLVLIFGDPETYKTFVTVRRFTTAKHDYYRSMEGEWFDIVRGGVS